MSAVKQKPSMRRLALAGLTVVALLLAQFISLSAWHHDHEHDAASKQHGGKQACLVCLFHSASLTSDFGGDILTGPQLVATADLPAIDDGVPPAIILTLWAGRGPPSVSVS